MRDLILSILILAVAICAVSVYATHEPFELSKEGWSVNGDSGDPVPGDGETGQMDVFAFNAEPNEIERQSPVSVNVEQPTEEKENPFPWEVFCLGIIAGVLAENIVIVVAVIVCTKIALSKRTGLPQKE